MLRSLFPPKFAQWLGPLLAAGGAAAVLAALLIFAGWIDLSARKPHPEGWARFLHFTFSRSTAAHRGPAPPADLDSPVRVAAGAAYYGQVCAHCHGGPGFGQSPVALSMRPRPQYLPADLKAAGLGPRELFRIVHDGVKYSAMPAWPAEGRDDEIWHLVAFLRALPTMTPQRFSALALTPPPGSASSGSQVAGRNGPAPQRRYSLLNDGEPPVASFSYSWPVYAFGNGIAGDPLTTCTRCHGADGAGGGAFPNLTIQDRRYLRRTLLAYATGRRESGFMRVVASQLSPAQITALADHYGDLPPRASDPAAQDDPLGRKLALEGDKASGLVPCAACHGVDRAAGQLYPLLNGQSRWYIVNQMKLFADGRRGTGPRDPMVAIAKRLTPAQIEAVARHYAAQPPAQGQQLTAGP